ncbi:unnamed protein product [Clonostachys rhizophaga]|uniref:Dihydroxyacetone kinase n=1 Tax=Clonostachys rhizophaga TaxID=160324 RepID=A0A9N9YHI1_9HYPO|nr:unnamed protein product [Clonostachys rhizophaga]
MPGKSFINDITNPVERALRSQLLRDPSLAIILSEKVLFRRAASQTDKVVLLSGGGSGHEPAHAGYLGEGMLDVVVAGEIFASPSSSQILRGITAAQSTKGTLLIVKNYTGDKLNFGLAAEKAKANGQSIEMVVVGDDVSVEGSSLVGQRGLAGTAFVHKVAGALAAKGASLKEVAAVAQKAASQMATVAASLDRCTVPGRGAPGLAADELEFGMGIHNEPGVRRSKIESLDRTVQSALDMLFAPKANMWQPKSGQKVALMLNNLGGLSVLELSVIFEEVAKQVATRGLEVVRSVVGSFVTSLDGPGFSISVLAVDDELLELLDAPTAASAWPRSIEYWEPSQDAQITSKIPSSEGRKAGPEVSTTVLKGLIASITKTVTEDEPKITEYDTLAGDGDCGQTLLNGVNGLVKELDGDQQSTIDIGDLFRRIASTAENSMGGTSGAIYAIFLNAVANNLVASSASHNEVAPLLRASLQLGIGELCRYTPARIGHRTLMDALIPFVDTFAQNGDFPKAVDEAKKGAEGTRRMEAALGRASYVGKERFEEEGGIPDPGALGIVSILRGILAELSKAVQ